MSDFFQRLTDREKYIYNQGVLDSDEGMKEFWEQIKAKTPIEKSILRFLLNQNLCAPCKAWIETYIREAYPS
jgi:hypothetical protein